MLLLPTKKDPWDSLSFAALGQQGKAFFIIGAFFFLDFLFSYIPSHYDEAAIGHAVLTGG